jgi:glycosyltransferase involved in cell wall biosynthesis
MDMISVVITTKDRKKFLLRAVKSVLENTLQPIDIIIVNDGGERVESEDFCYDGSIIIDVVNNQYSKGGNVARNQGVRKAKGDIIFFLDDDDAFTPKSIESRSKYFEDSSVGLVYTGKQLVKSDSLDQVYYVSKPKHEGILAKTLFEQGNIIGTTSCVALRKTTFEKVGGFDEELLALQDYDLWIRVARECEIKHDRESNIIYTVHNSNKQISADYQKYIQAGIYLYDKYAQDLKKLRLEKQFLAARYLRVAMVASKQSSLMQFKYALISLKNKLSLKAFFMLLPVVISKKIRNFH